MRKLAIAVCYFYPEKEYLYNNACIPIQVGYDETHIDMGIQKDCDGDNRGSKHPYYSELSGLYWIWKNVDAEYKGLFHHRRAFTLQKESLSSRFCQTYHLLRSAIACIFHSKKYICLNQIYLSAADYNYNLQNFIEGFDYNQMSRYDIIVPVPARFHPLSVEQHFSIMLDCYIFKLLSDIIEEKWPNYNIFWQRTLNGRKLYYGNISLMRSDLFNLYCFFVFSVLDELENKLLNNEYYFSLTKEKSMSRKFGYIGELLTNAFILSQYESGTNIKELYVMLCADARSWV